MDKTAKPSKSILDKSFPYVPAHLTNIRERFEKIRREMAEKSKNVVPLPRKEQACPKES